jgi:hypothetical protein
MSCHVWRVKALPDEHESTNNLAENMIEPRPRKILGNRADRRGLNREP